MKSKFLGMGALALFASQPLGAEVTESDDDGFVTRDEAVVDADPKTVWLALISPARWWNSSHTWSGDSANLTLMPQAGGCFCERIPEDPDPAKITLEGSVEHMRVIHAFPETALRLQGALGPLQSEPVVGVLTIAISEVDEGTRIVWEYAVGGSMRFEVPVIANAVDGVMSEQLNGLAEALGRSGAAGEASGSSETDDDETGAEASEGAGVGDDFLEGINRIH
ncbi:MAG: SRPBCC family protein [Erythrobacter sp.]